MERIYKYKYLINSSIASKQKIFFMTLPVLYAKLVAGLYKPSSLKLEHNLILASLSGSLPIFKNQLHGKRKKRTVSLNNEFSEKYTRVFDKIIHELLPKIPDFVTPKMKKSRFSNYSLKINQKFPALPDFEDLISQSLYNDHRGVFLPLHVHFLFKNSEILDNATTVHYLKMMRLPMFFYTKNKKPAFDDPVTFNQLY